MKSQKNIPINFWTEIKWESKIVLTWTLFEWEDDKEREVEIIYNYEVKKDQDYKDFVSEIKIGWDVIYQDKLD